MIILIFVFFLESANKHFNDSIVKEKIMFFYKINNNISTLISGNDRDKADSAEWLGENKIVIAVPLLCDCLASPNNNLRSYAACALGEIGDKSAIPHLRTALKREEDLFRQDIFARGWARAMNSITCALEKLEE